MTHTITETLDWAGHPVISCMECNRSMVFKYWMLPQWTNYKAAFRRQHTHEYEFAIGDYVSIPHVVLFGKVYGVRDAGGIVIDIELPNGNYFVARPYECRKIENVAESFSFGKDSPVTQ